jgi:hypothetical protein
MRVALTRDAEAFARRATPLLEARMENNLLATVLAAQRARRSAGGLFATVEDDAGRVVGAALRTAGRPMLATGLQPAAAVELIDRWLAEDPELAGVNAQTATARALADAWCERTGAPRRCALFTDLANPTSNRIYAEVGSRHLCDWESVRLGAT